jgi:hypothetical protein
MFNYALNRRNSRAHARLSSDVMSAGLVVGRIQVDGRWPQPDECITTSKRVFHVVDPINCCVPVFHGLSGHLWLRLRPDQALRADGDPVDADAVWVHPPWVLDGPAIVLRKTTFTDSSGIQNENHTVHNHVLRSQVHRWHASQEDAFAIARVATKGHRRI